MEPQTYENDANGNMIVPERQAGSMETEPAWEYVLEKTGDSVLDDANYLAAMYDYDGAIAKIQSVSGYESNAAYTAAIADYEQRKSEAGVLCVGMGSKLFPKETVAAGDWAAITAKCQEAHG